MCVQMSRRAGRPGRQRRWADGWMDRPTDRPVMGGQGWVGRCRPGGGGGRGGGGALCDAPRSAPCTAMQVAVLSAENKLLTQQAPSPHRPPPTQPCTSACAPSLSLSPKLQPWPKPQP